MSDSGGSCQMISGWNMLDSDKTLIKSCKILVQSL